MKESEPIYGLAFIAFQNYINGSAMDFSYDLKAKENIINLKKIRAFTFPLRREQVGATFAVWQFFSQQSYVF